MKVLRLAFMILLGAVLDYLSPVCERNYRNWKVGEAIGFYFLERFEISYSHI